MSRTKETQAARRAMAAHLAKRTASAMPHDDFMAGWAAAMSRMMDILEVPSNDTEATREARDA